MSHVSYYEQASEGGRVGVRERGKKREQGVGGEKGGERECMCVWEGAVPLHKLLQGLGALQLSMGM